MFLRNTFDLTKKGQERCYLNGCRVESQYGYFAYLLLFYESFRLRLDIIVAHTKGGARLDDTLTLPPSGVTFNGGGYGSKSSFVYG